ncbi:probable signal transduction histidine kinase sensor [Psychrobacter arcticus 273-4]|uniref:histidine kinase n=1 Tax=Psychrobacter arcticus (strain DSM 17307 / VKM B-2377 / 273-4) TaxID=259536 RepID=Q4FPY4_PSYA2|nr:ATP-binding protein [Psychrobacter arcticus]AAZ19924.1 probable signal transduction histidine kinase sensor [Psychrobacter arcticus 273-4]
MKSIQQRLLTSLLIGLPLLWVLTSSFIAWKLWHEINEMNDTQITQVARYLIGVAPKEDDDKDNHGQDESKKEHTPKIYNLKSKRLSGDLGEAEDDYMGFAIWDKKGRLLMADENGQSFAFLPDQYGFLEERDSAYQRLNPFSKRWRLFYVHDDHDHEGRVIAVGQNLKSRQEMIVDAMSVQLLPMLIGLFAFMGLVVWLIRRGFMPLTQISSELEQRQPQDDSPITADVPKEIQPLVSALNILFVKVADTLAREQRFTADASHELRSPLAALKLQADLLQQQILPLSGVEDDNQLFYHTQKISNGIERATHLVEQLLILAKIEPQQQLPPEQLESPDWLMLTDIVLSDVNRLAREKRIQLKRTVNCNNPADILPILINPTLFKLLIRNLLDNAIRYCPEGALIELQLDTNAIRVVDNGIGVEPEQLTRLSERFYRPAGQSQLGSGLGLSIANQIAELHSLTLEFANRSQPETGFIVTIRNKKAISRT